MTLFWNERGSVTCAGHAPYPGTDTWTWERWQAITDDERNAAREQGIDLKCEVGRNCRDEV